MCRLGLAVMVLGLSVLLSHCDKAQVALEEAEGSSEAERAVEAYTDALVAAYKTRDVTLMEPVATRKEGRKIAALIDLKTAAGLVLESTKEALEVTSVEYPSDQSMVVEAKERWRYFDRPLAPGMSPGQEFVTEMLVRYEFIKEDDTWKMDVARTLAHEYLQPMGFSHEEHATHGELGESHGGRGGGESHATPEPQGVGVPPGVQSAGEQGLQSD